GDINAILKEAEERNLSLLSARLAQDVSRENIRLAETGHMPTVSLDASTSVTNSYQHGSGYNTPYGGSASNSYNGQNSIGLNLSIPL
ncbi:TolC family protein, partial [Escherichia coli]|nr:TolC family protein [Escherichia coli]